MLQKSKRIQSIQKKPANILRWEIELIFALKLFTELISCLKFCQLSVNEIDLLFQY